MSKKIDSKTLLDQDTLTYQQILNLKKRMTGYGKKPENINDYKWGKEYNLTPDHTQKGLEWLYNIAFKPSRLAHVLAAKDFTDEDLRNTCPLGYRELVILLHFDRFTFTEFYHACNYYQESQGYHNLLPIWKTYDKDGDSFEYYLQGGEMHIIG